MANTGWPWPNIFGSLTAQQQQGQLQGLQAGQVINIQPGQYVNFPQPSHDDATNALLGKLIAEKRFADWVRERKRRLQTPDGFFIAAPGCSCPWCQLSELERQVALAKASEEP